MKYSTEDKTLERNYKNKWRHLISEYELIKQKKHTKYKFVGEFYKAHNISKQLFNKIYRKFTGSGNEDDLLPGKRGPKWTSRRPDITIEEGVIEQRKLGLNKYEICDILKRKNGHSIVSPSGVYNIIKRAGMNVLREEQKEIKRRIIKENPGELGHIDCHYLSKDLIDGSKKQYYLVGLIDSCSRVAWCEVVENIKSLSVMFATLRLFSMLKTTYNIEFKAMLTDNGPEFASKNNIQTHPFDASKVALISFACRPRMSLLRSSLV